MKSIFRIAAPLAAGAVAASVAHAGGEVFVSSDISGVVNWTNDNTYNLQGQIYVLPGATLIIQEGTVIASDLGGSLAVTRDGQIFANGTADAPIIFTSKLDVATWDADASHPTGGDPKTGTWREGLNEWGNLTLMGNGFISEDANPANTASPNPANFATMEGLTEEFVGDTKILYGGGDDDDDSGVLNYVSIRFGGKVIGLNNELNGLSMGGIGRGTDVQFVEIMNNVDDGIETWGGTVNYKHFSIWNVGDDSFDVDQGWRGKAQFGTIVQGFSGNFSQGSGVGDNCFETDGAENCNWQPVTSATIYNCTVVGQPADGDYGTAWRDNARVQYRNCVFMDLGDQLVQNDGDDGDGACGYGGGLPAGQEASTFAELWTTPFSSYFPHNWNPGLGVTQAEFYPVQVDGNLAEITDSVFFRVNKLGDAPVDLTLPIYNNVNVASVVTADGPIKGITRGAPVVKGGKTMLQVLKLDPRAANDATTSVGSAPNDGFFTPVSYRGAHGPTKNSLWGWTASDAFGFTTLAATQTVRNGAVANPNVFLPGSTDPNLGSVWNPSIDHTSFVPGAFLDFVVFSGAQTDTFVPGFGSFLVGFNPFLTVTNLTPGSAFAIPVPSNTTFIGTTLYTQGGSFELSGAITLANGIDIVIGNE